jgi:hypothetical protein
MKMLIIILLFPIISNADWNGIKGGDTSWGGVISGTLHKTPNGKYPFFYDDGGHNNWNETDQKNYDEKMSATIKQLCSDNVSLGELERQHIDAEHVFYSDEKNKNKFFIDIERGKKMDVLKTDMTRLSNIVMKGTGQSARVWGCP